MEVHPTEPPMCTSAYLANVSPDLISSRYWFRSKKCSVAPPHANPPTHLEPHRNLEAGTRQLGSYLGGTPRLPPSPPLGGERGGTNRRLVVFNATPGSRVHPDERFRTVRTNAPPPSGEVRVPLYGRHRLFSELAGACHTHTHTCTSKGICPRMI